MLVLKWGMIGDRTETLGDIRLVGPLDGCEWESASWFRSMQDATMRG